MSNKWRYDVKNVKYAVGKWNPDGTIDFSSAAIKDLPGAQTLEAKASGSSSKIRADGINYIVANSNDGYDLTLTQVLATEDFKIDCLGYIKDKATGILYEDANADLPPYALLGEFSGNAEGIRWAYYNCVASRPDEKGDNKSNQKDPDTDSISMTASPVPVLIGGEEKLIVKGSVHKSDNETTYTNWFKSVTYPTGASGSSEGS